MNLSVLVGRLTRDPELNYAKETQMAIARFTVAVDRGTRREGEPTADFFNCVAFDRKAEFVDKYFSKGMRVLVSGKLRNENYTNKEGEKVYRDSLLADLVEFADGKDTANQTGETNQSKRQMPQESQKQASQPKKTVPNQTPSRTSGARSAAPSRGTSGRAPVQQSAARKPAATSAFREGFMNIPDGVEDEGFPFN